MHRTAIIVAGLAGLPLGHALAQPCGNPWSVGSTGPSARRDYAAAYDSVRNKVVVFGGAGQNGVLLNDTWEWTATGPGGGGGWKQRAGSGPSPRSHAGMAFDASRGKMVLFGGRTGPVPNYTNETWEWNGTAWSQVAAATPPPAMEGALFTYDPSITRTVLVSSLLSFPNEYEFNGTAWTTIFGPGPAAQGSSFSALSYDALRPARVFIGGVFSPSGGNLPATWGRRQGTWQTREYGHLRSSNWAGPRLCYDPGLQKVLLVDATNPSGLLGVWSWDGDFWYARSTNGPPARTGFTPVVDVAGGQVVIFGGANEQGTLSNEVHLFRSDRRSGPMLSDFRPRVQVLPLFGGASYPIRVAANGTPPFTYQWRLNGVTLFDGGSFSGTTTAELRIVPDDDALEGNYDCVVTDACGMTVRPVTRVFIDCYPNCDGSTSFPAVNAEDFQCFINRYAAGCPVSDCYANCDESTTPPFLNANDFQCFIDRVARGCF